MQPIISPWANAFDEFVGSINESAIIAAPFITKPGVTRLVQGLSSKKSVILEILTSLNEHSLAEGLSDSGALSWLCNQVPGASVRHLRHLHAKAYVADAHTAIITSANLTNGGLLANHELGVAITDTDVVGEISQYLQKYASVGVPVSVEALGDLNDLAEQAQVCKAQAEDSASDTLKTEFDSILGEINETLVKLRTGTEAFLTNTKESITSQFTLAVELALGQHGPMRTRDLNPVVQSLLWELCDDKVDRVINGVSFGRKWKHHTRNAQQRLQRAGVIALENGYWRLS